MNFKGHEILISKYQKFIFTRYCIQDMSNLLKCTDLKNLNYSMQINSNEINHNPSPIIIPPSSNSNSYRCLLCRLCDWHTLCKVHAGALQHHKHSFGHSREELLERKHQKHSQGYELKVVL
jgi:hypothetical protein